VAASVSYAYWVLVEVVDKAAVSSTVIPKKEVSPRKAYSAPALAERGALSA
jgi:hypothetical protein